MRWGTHCATPNWAAGALLPGSSRVSAEPALLEVVENFDRATYRAVYTTRFEGAVYVLHAFQKKSRHGIATPRRDIELIRERLKKAKAHYRKWRAERGTQG